MLAFGGAVFSLLNFSFTQKIIPKSVHSYSEQLFLLESLSVFGAAVLLSSLLYTFKSIWMCILYHVTHNILTNIFTPIFPSNSYLINFQSINLFIEIIIQLLLFIWLINFQKPFLRFRSHDAVDLF
jgi:hypothetical protein